jgi:hypothetical protein
MSGQVPIPIPNLPVAAGVSASDLLAIWQNGATKQATVGQVINAQETGVVADAQTATVNVTMTTVGSGAMSVGALAAWTAGAAISVGQAVQAGTAAFVSVAMISWPAITYVYAGEYVKNGGNAYVCTVSGYTAASGGPAGNGAAITDGTAVWAYNGVVGITGATQPAIIEDNDTSLDGGVLWMRLGGGAFAATFSAADVGKTISLRRLDFFFGHQPWYTNATPVTITAVNSPTSIVVSQPLSSSPGGSEPWPFNSVPCVLVWGTDNSPAMQAAANAVSAMGGGELFIPAGQYLFASTVTVASQTFVRGERGATWLIGIGRVDTPTTGALFTNTAMTDYWPTLSVTGLGVNGAATQRQYLGDQNIHFTDLCFDQRCTDHGGVGGISLFLTTTTTVTFCEFRGSFSRGITGVQHIGTDQSFLAFNKVTNAYNGGFDNWAGYANHRVAYNLVSCAPSVQGHNGPVGMQFNAVGLGISSPGGDTQIVQGLDVIGNTVRMSAYANQSGNFPITVWPDSQNSAMERIKFALNTFISPAPSQRFNDGVLIRGNISGVQFVENIVEGFGRNAVRMGADSSGLAVTKPTTLTPTNGSNLVNVYWPASNVTGTNLTVGMAVFVNNGGPSVGGVALTGWEPVVSVTDANNFTIQIQANASDSTPVAWNAAYATVTRYPVDARLANNVMRNCDYAGSGHSIVQLYARNGELSHNKSSFPVGYTPAYNFAYYMEGPSRSNGNFVVYPGYAMGNTAPDGTGALPAGIDGSNRLAWNHYTGAPIGFDVSESGQTQTATGPIGGPISGATVTNSTVDSTPVGQTTPAAGSFSAFHLLAGGSTVPSNGVWTFNDPAVSITTPAMNEHISVSGTSSGAKTIHGFSIDADSAALTGGYGYGYQFAHYFGGATLTGNRQAVNIVAALTAASGNAGRGGFYGALAAQWTTNVADVTPGVSGNNTLALASSLKTGATGWLGLQSAEFDLAIETGASATYKGALYVVLQNNDQVHATRAEAALAFSTAPGTNTPVGWNMLFSVGWSQAWWPMSITGTIIGTTPATDTGPWGAGPSYACAWGVDFSAITFSGGAFKSNGFLVDGSGNVSASKFATGSAAGPTWTGGAGAPSGTQPKGSIYSRIDGGVGSTLYVSQGGGTWNAVAGV